MTRKSLSLVDDFEEFTHSAVPVVRHCG